MELLEILKIKELDSLFSCKIRLLLTWVDQVTRSLLAQLAYFSCRQRLQFNNLKNDSDYNSLSAAEREKVTDL